MWIATDVHPKNGYYRVSVFDEGDYWTTDGRGMEEPALDCNGEWKGFRALEIGVLSSIQLRGRGFPLPGYRRQFVEKHTAQEELLDALSGLVRQIAMGNYKNDLGMALKMNQSYVIACELIDIDDICPRCHSDSWAPSLPDPVGNIEWRCDDCHCRKWQRAAAEGSE